MNNKLKEGETLFADNRIEEAEKCFLSLIENDTDCKEACNNLGVIAFQRDDNTKAIDYFTRSLEIDPLYRDAVLNYTGLLRTLNQIHIAIPLLKKITEINPNDDEITQLLEEIRYTPLSRLKIAILCLPGYESFLKDIVNHLKTNHDVQTCYTNNEQEIESSVEWADIVWLEWANSIAAHVTHKIPSVFQKKVICRIHSYEVLHGYLPRIDWSKIDMAIFVANHIRDIALEICPFIVNETKCHVIENGVDLQKFTFSQREPGFNIAVVGDINYKKNPAMWIEIVSRLVKINPQYTLKVAGVFQELNYKYYFENIIHKLGIEKNIKFCGRVKDIPEWFERENINYILTTSVFESFGYGIAEAMAMGYKPLINNFPGTDVNWPSDCIFSTTDELIELLSDTVNYNSQEYYEFVKTRYSLGVQLDAIDLMLTVLTHSNMESFEINLKEGEALFARGKNLEAEQAFLSLIEKGLTCKQAYNNLGVISAQKNDVKSAIDYFTKSLEIDPCYKDAIVNYIKLLSSLNQLHIARPLLEKIANKYPDDEEITNLVEYICSSNNARHKVAVICPRGLESFIGDIVDFLKARYEVRVCHSTNVQEVDSTIMWSDIVWLEWANELSIKLTNHPDNILKDKQTICRLHSYEAFEGFVTKINWKNINELIFVAEHIKNIVIQQVPDLPQLVSNIHIVPNGINMDKFSSKDRVRGKDLAFFGSITFKKGPMLLLHAFRELVQKDNEYRLFIAGDFQESRYRYYYSQMVQELGLENNIIYNGKITDVAGWLEDKQYVVCTSLLEGHPVGLMEAMARGLKPLIHNFVGARGIYPNKYLWNTIPDFVRMATEDDYDPAEYRNFIETHYSLEKQTESIETIFTQMCKTSVNNSHSTDKMIAELEVCA